MIRTCFVKSTGKTYHFEWKGVFWYRVLKLFGIHYFKKVTCYLDGEYIGNIVNEKEDGIFVIHRPYRCPPHTRYTPLAGEGCGVEILYNTLMTFTEWEYLLSKLLANPKDCPYRMTNDDGVDEYACQRCGEQWDECVCVVQE